MALLTSFTDTPNCSCCRFLAWLAIPEGAGGVVFIDWKGETCIHRLATATHGAIIIIIIYETESSRKSMQSRSKEPKIGQKILLVRALTCHGVP